MAEYISNEQKKKFYKSKDWESIRQEVLKRDNYECQQCKKEGKVYTNNHEPDKHKRLDVDHIKEIHTHPELALDIDNLRTLCVRHHNIKHNRFFYRHKKNQWNDERW